jgi:hypothetical protein
LIFRFSRGALGPKEGARRRRSGETKRMLEADTACSLPLIPIIRKKIPKNGYFQDGDDGEPPLALQPRHRRARLGHPGASVPGKSRSRRHGIPSRARS